MGKQLTSYFTDIWGSKETRYSRLFAQTIILSEPFRGFIGKKINVQKHSLSEIIEIVPEKVFDDNNRQIDIYLKTNDGLVIGIENKKWAGLQGKQLIDYDQSLRNISNNNYRLIFLSPSTYYIKREDEPDGLIKLSYKEVIQWIKDNQANFHSQFEINYFDQLKNYMEDLEMKPFSGDDIQLLRHSNKIYDLQKRLRAIVDVIRENHGIEDRPGGDGFILTYEERNNFKYYFGFRVGTNWYYKSDLLNDSPECLIYIKDDWDDSEQLEMNERVKKIYNKLEAALLDRKSGKLCYYERKQKDECRMSLRKSLSDFQDADVDEIIKWFKDNISILEKCFID